MAGEKNAKETPIAPADGVTEAQEVEMAESKQEDEKTPAAEENKQPAAEEELPILEAEKVKALVAESKLPDAFKMIIEHGVYESEDALKTALESATAEVKRITGSGSPFAMGGANQKIQSEKAATLNEAYKAIEEKFSIEPLFNKR